MTRAVDLEIGSHGCDGQTFAVKMRLPPPDVGEEICPDSASTQLDLDALRGTGDEKS